MNTCNNHLYLLSINFVLLINVVIAGLPLVQNDPDQDLTLFELIKSRGFDVEKHSVETEDGYILSVHRIINPDISSKVQLKPVIVQHGLFGSSSDFCINSPFLRTNNSKYGDTIAFSLAITQRYDVWLGNSRGNRYSLRHKNHSYDSREFWNFSWDHMATKDLPAVINYVKKVSNSKTVAYVGYSQGTAIMFTLLSLYPEFADVIRPFIALAPITFVADLKAPMAYLAPSEPLLRTIGGEFLPSPHFLKTLASRFCSNRHFQAVCANLIFLFGGFDTKNLNETRIGVYLHFTPSTTSAWDIAHWAQLVNTKSFRRFDYGKMKNNEHYGTDTPPDIPLKNIPNKMKIALFQGSNDILSTKNNVDRLKEIFKNSGLKLVRDFIVSDPYWTHLDFLFGENAGQLFIEPMIDTLDQYA